MKLMDRIKGVALGIAFLHAGEDMQDPTVHHEHFPTDNSRVESAPAMIKPSDYTTAFRL